MKVHLLYAGFDWEGSQVIAVYADEQAAKEMCEKLEMHRDAKPRHEDLDAFEAAYAKWTKECPLEGADNYDYYHVISKEVIGCP